MIASSAVFSLMSTLIRLASAVDPFKTSLFRFTIGLAVLATLALFGKIRLEFKNIPLLVVRGVTGGFAVLFFYLAIARIGLAKGTVISNIYPIFAAIGGAIFLRERMRPAAWLFVVTCIAGVVLVNHNAGEGLLHVDPWTVLAFIGALFSAVAVVCVRKLSSTDSPYSIFLSQCVFGLWMVVVPANSVPASFSITTGVLLCAIGLSATVAQLLMTASYRHVDVATGSLLSMLMVVFNVAIGILCFGEARSPLSITGMLVVVLSCAGIVYVNKRSTRSRRRPADSTTVVGSGTAEQPPVAPIATRP